MGTNYYLHKKPCPTCGHSDEILHIGKSSIGWCFSLHVDEYQNINSLEDWKKLMLEEGAEIRNEYDEKVSFEEMMETITNRQYATAGAGKYFGYTDEAHFHRANKSQPGPNGLVRHKVDGIHCVGQGDGTWDLLTGEFM